MKTIFEVYDNGKKLAEFETHSEAALYLQKNQSQSYDWATTHAGWKVLEVAAGAGKESFLEHLNKFCRAIEDAYKKSWPDSVHEFKVSYSKGGKYYRIIKEYCGQKSVHSFVDGNGYIWKAASWKTPAKNFSRGNIFELVKASHYGF